MSASASKEIALLGASVLALTLSGQFVHQRLGSSAFFLLIILCACGAARAAVLCGRPDRPGALVIVLVVAALLRLTMLGADNYFSSDVFRYVWDGRVQAAGINPYRFVPAAPDVAFLRDAAIYPHINRADYAVTIYPPGAQLIFFLITRLGDSLLVMKAGLVAFDGVSIVALMAILRKLGHPPAVAVAYAWHPLPVWEIAANGHLDAAMVAFIMLGLWAALAARPLLAGVLVAMAAMVKPIALVVLPALWRPWDWRLPAVVMAIAIVTTLPYLGVGLGIFGFWPGYVTEEGLASGDRYWLLSVLQNLTGPIPGGTVLYLVSALAVLGGMALAASFRRDRSPEAAIAGAAWLIFTFLLLLSPNFPWYFLALAPFLALTRQPAFWAMTTLAFLLYDVIPDDRVMTLTTRQNLLYGTTLVCLLYSLWIALRRSKQAANGDAPT
ncbi:MAG: DUF2029 domain-containing protein [Beijerinckiaceae bacterium]|nr:DUF2029 domain-containing protein [Beijerinckiaceae bacterium]